MRQVARSQVPVGVQAVSDDQHLLQIQILELAYQRLGLGSFDREAFAHDQAIPTHQLRQDATHGSAVHLLVHFLSEIARLSSECNTTRTPQR